MRLNTNFRCAPALPDTLDGILHSRGGRVYLARAARCAPERVREGYPGFLTVFGCIGVLPAI